MHALLPSALAVVMLLGAAGCSRQSAAERLADVSRAAPPGSVDIGVPTQSVDGAPRRE